MTQEAAQYPNELICADEIRLPSGDNCENGCIHVYCNGVSPAKCSRIILEPDGRVIAYAVYAVGYCTDFTVGTLYVDNRYDGGSWTNIFSSAGGDSISYTYWNWTGAYFGAPGAQVRFRFGSDINNPTQVAEFYLNWFYLVIHIQDYAGTPLSGVTTTWTSTDGQSGSGTTSIINILVPSGTSVTYSCAPYYAGAGNYTSAEVCSTTVSNITADITSTTKMYPVDFCNTMDTMINVGSTLSAFFGVVLKNMDISDSPRSCVISVLQNGSEVSTEIMYPNTWSDDVTLADGTIFKFRCGEIFYGFELQTIEIFEWCYSNRPNKSVNVDSSIIYVDCTNGNNTNTGRCSFINAVQTITYAQTLIDDGGTIKVKYGNCLSEDLAAVLNPIGTTVYISPVQDDLTEGTGTLYIDGT